MKLSTIRPYQPGDELVRFRDEDEAEVRAAGGGTCAVVVACAARGGEVEVAVDPHTSLPAAFFGLCPIDADHAAVWMLATDAIKQNARSVAALAPQWLERAHALYPVLGNYVDARNELHIRWLKRLGFTFIKLHERFGVEQRPFYEFVRLPHV